MGEGYVYVGGTGEPGDPVKIGWSASPEKRIEQLQTASAHTLRVLDKHPGPRGLERFLHCRFAAERVRGEWFRLSDPVAQVKIAVSAWSPQDEVESGRGYGFPGSHVSVGIGQGRRLAAAGSGLTDRELRVLVWFCCAATGSQEPVKMPRSEIARELGMSTGGLAHALRALHQARLLLASDPIGRTVYYRVNPHVAFAGTSAEHRKTLADCAPPALN